MLENKGIVTAAFALLCLLAFAPLAIQADSLHDKGLIAQFSFGNHGRAIGVNEHFEQVTCESDNTLNLALQKPFGDVPYLLGMPSTGGRNIGFSIAAFHRGPRLGLVRPGSTAAVTQNPEPATMLLLGTGLTALAAVARKRTRRLPK
jgi:PEP-CTERM motif